MRKVEVTGGEHKGEVAFFHGFFQVGNLERGCDPVAVIEFSNGTCGDYSSSYIRFINPPAKELVAMLSELIKEQEGFIAVERLAGNIVKEEFHKGALFGLLLAERLIESTDTPCSADKIKL